MDHSGIPSMTPRNKKQAYNVKYRVKLEQRHDDLFESYLFAQQNPEIIAKLELIPGVVLVQVHPEMSLHFTSLQKTGCRLVLHYDTTFDVGRFYTSILSLRHPIFKNEPLIPLAVMFHEHATELSHNAFFQATSGHLNLNGFHGVVVTDREKGIVNAIRSNMTQATNLFCWNHIRKASA